MIRELDQSEFYKCEKLMNKAGHIEVQAVIAGNNPGRIFVDDIDDPKTGLIWLGNHDGFFFIGDEENETFTDGIDAFIDDVIHPEAERLGVRSFIAIGNHLEWEPVIENVFAHRPMQISDQKVYKLKQGHNPSGEQPSMEHGYEIHKITESLMEEESIQNTDFLRSKLQEFWTSPEHSFKKGIGYCVIKGNKIVSSCFSGFVAENVHGLDIETLEEHQGKGLGQQAANAVVKECVSKGNIPYWDCEEANGPSNAVAKKVGLEHHLDYLVYIFPFDRNEE
ncbi:GNAT family N-acetyltransferase [Halobacillus salinus]|uniref:GNAT family N-acetyltransferase n=1 Tax=Halobacillus salinus TaxID=192814 RepID=A0A4Z0H122_9BACI|nr:GNAT family N-acetyltransferase [Halobacillus salinus]TGB03547.1 GNAT family N-acetyltransferase [Halobacillus salinus]